MNSYGTTVGPQHTLVGRIAPMCEAFRLALHHATNIPPFPTRYAKDFPQWAHKIGDELTKTIFKGIVRMAPKDSQPNETNANKVGQMYGLMIRMVIYFWKEVPAQIERDGLNKLTPEQNQRLEKVIGLELLVPEASELAGRPVTNQEEIKKFIRRRILKFLFQQVRLGLRMINFILHRQAGEVFQFLSGMPKGFKGFLNTDGKFAGKGKRTEIFLLLLMFWPEIEEMRQSQPPKTRKFLLEWLEKIEGKQLVVDPKVFYELCDDIDLDLAPPGHPASVSSD
ncbi:MAG TPA: hypothetical protein VMV89_09695 [Candidatus Paceibacterota bacterium]|nr:hypothetical protein [Candidatus Paceibacterota bacterium]